MERSQLFDLMGELKLYACITANFATKCLSWVTYGPKGCIGAPSPLLIREQS